MESIIELLNNEEQRGQVLETIAQHEAGKEYLNNYAKIEAEKIIGQKIGELHGGYDRDFEEVTGVKKPEGVKSYTFWKEHFKGVNEKAKSVNTDVLDQIKKENEELKLKMENNEQAKYFKDLYESTKTTYQKQLEEKENFINQFQTERMQMKIKGDLSAAIAKLELNSELPEDVKNTYIETVFNSLMKGAKVMEDGSIVYYDGDTLLTDSKTAQKATAEYLLQSRLKSILVEKKVVTGGGGQDPNKTKSKSSVSFSHAKTQMELNTLIEESLLADGFLKGKTDFQAKKNELFKEFSNGLPLR
jgi:hypothetical protein